MSRQLMPEAQCDEYGARIHDPHRWSTDHGLTYAMCPGRGMAVPADIRNCVDLTPHGPHRWSEDLDVYACAGVDAQLGDVEASPVGDVELATIALIVDTLRDLDRPARQRILSYLHSRFSL